MYINRNRNDIKNQILSFEYNMKNNVINKYRIKHLLKRSICKGYFDNTFLYRLLKDSSRGYNNIFFYHNKKDNSLRAYFLYGKSKYNISSFLIIDRNTCASAFKNFTINNTENQRFYDFVYQKGRKLLDINEKTIEESSKYIMNIFNYNIERFLNMVSNNFKHMKIANI